MVYNTWAQKCDNFKFILKFTPNLSVKNNKVYLNGIDIELPAHTILDPGIVNETYRKLTDKTYLSLIYIDKHYSDYDWYLKADDDTYVFIDNLRKFVSSKNSTEPTTFGFDFSRYVKNGYHSGGAGYIISKEALRRIAHQLRNNYSSCPNRGVEDVDVASCFRTVQVYPGFSRDFLGRERFHPLPIKNLYYGRFPKWFLKFSAQVPAKGLKCCSDESISFHYMRPVDQYRIHALVQQFENLPSNCNRKLRFIDIVHEILG
ncbi:glyco -N-acetylgalactosamine 3-beta-galactosyltransferase 1 [Brachionus plicatilis]|uniref:N-acetylgalactosaminide beta-1,3-galactosyltransferase n=1 Tax=Brachionus plicatilis TaxID=10195 RepID=A0A3M7SPG8_BRAPC|nr:glyco -N-acetylgalactosamine 3-beta-galactosyltransferase 1 [Brachionus plicatilis]